MYKRVAIIHDYFLTPGGAEKVGEDLMKTFPDADIYTAIYRKDFESNIFQEKLKKGKVFASVLNILPKNKFLLRVYRKLSFLFFPLFNLSKYDLLVVSTSGPAGWIKKREGQKVVVYYHKIPSFQFLSAGFEEKDFVNNGELMLLKQRKILKFIDNWFANRNKEFVNNFDVLLSNSTSYSKNFPKLFNREAIVINPCFGDSEIFNNLKPTQKSEYYVFVGRLEKYKGVDLIAECLQELNLKLVVIGEGTLKEKLKTFTNVELKGFVSGNEKLELLSNAKAFINGSIEDFGIVFCESILCYTPIITPIGGGIDEIAKLGVSYLGYTIQDKDSLLDAIKRFEKNNLVIEEKDRQYVLEKFSFQNFSNKIIAVC